MPAPTMTPEQITAMNNWSNGLARSIFNEMAPRYFPQVMSETDKDSLKAYYATLAKGYYKFVNGFAEPEEQQG